MLVYWIMFLLFAWASFIKLRGNPYVILLGWGMLWLALTLLIGFRHQVGGDWGNYSRVMGEFPFLSFWEAVKRFDPAHGAMNWLSSYMDWGVYGANLLYGGIFSLGLIAFCRAQPRPVLALAVAMPYLIVVVAMGYSRQGVAIGVMFFALLALSEQKTAKFIRFVALAALFHKSAVVLVPIAALANSKRRIWTGLWVIATSLLMYLLYLHEASDSLVTNYIDAQYASEGGAIRVAMNAVPAALFLANRKHFQLVSAEQILWTWLSLIALAFIPILLLSPSSTAVDRVALYFIPLQLYVFSRLPNAVFGGRHRIAMHSGVIVFYGLVLFVWLNYATHAKYWLPYRFYPLLNL